jgi:hypothetical protein
MDTLLRKLLTALEENRYPPTPEGVRRMVLDLFPGENAEALAEKVLEEARGRTRKALEGVWKAFALPSPPPGVEKALLEGSHITVWYSGRQSRPELRVWPQGEDKACLSLTQRVPCRELLLNSRAGWVEVEVTPGLFATTGRAFLQACSPDEVEEALQAVKALRPLFASLDLEDLEGALLALAALREGEARTEGPYVLARTGGSWFLRRGSLLGAPALDATFLTGQEVALTFPGGVDLALRGALSKDQVGLQEGVLRFQGEVLRFRSQGDYCDVLHERPVSHLVRVGLWYEVEKPKRSYSPKMQALLEAVREEEDPLEALKDHGFLRKALLKVISQL